MNKQYLKGQVKSDGNNFSVIASTDVVDRQGESIDQNGWDLTNYKNNPVILWAHDYSSLPIGKATVAEVVDGQLQMSGVFADHTMAKDIAQLYKDGFLNTVSVGFIPKERNGNVITKSELLEVSFVPVPANPEALSLIRTQKGFTVERDILIELIEKCAEVDVTEPKEAEEVVAKVLPPVCDVASPEYDKEKCLALVCDPTSEMFDEGICALVNTTEDEEESDDEEKAEKTGRVLSKKNRDLIETSISSMKISIANLEDLLTATEVEKEVETEIGDVKKLEFDNGLVEIPVELLKELLSQNRKVDRNVELSNSVLKRILDKVN